MQLPDGLWWSLSTDEGYLSVLAYLRWNYRTHRGAETYRLPHDITRYNYLTRRECRGGEVVKSEVG